MDYAGQEACADCMEEVPWELLEECDDCGELFCEGCIDYTDRWDGYRSLCGSCWTDPEDEEEWY